MSLLTSQFVEAAAHAVRICAATLFIGAGLAKVRDLRRFVLVVADYRVLPTGLALPIGWALPPLEITTGVLLIFGAAKPGAAIIAALMLLVFAAAIAINLRRGRTGIDCGCSFGSGGSTVHSAQVAQNALLALLLLVTAGADVPSSPLLWAMASAAGVALLMISLIFNQLAEPKSRFVTNR
ncbi:MAG TPA: MauE/DoxX family redox-associated membrane protein [Burkholderiales bacterium]|uniref:MauE/DoxX family redox-associated membrane protein n=1 Tax=Sphingobium sp. TaxID=1912891 RepID=UPI002ED23D1E